MIEEREAKIGKRMEKRRKNHHVRIADHFCSLVAEVGDASRNEIREKNMKKKGLKEGRR